MPTIMMEKQINATSLWNYSRSSYLKLQTIKIAGIDTSILDIVATSKLVQKHRKKWIIVSSSSFQVVPMNTLAIY